MLGYESSCVVAVLAELQIRHSAVTRRGWASIVPERIEHGIAPEQRWGKRHVFTSAPAYGIESSFCKAAMARPGSLICAVTRANEPISGQTESLAGVSPLELRNQLSGRFGAGALRKAGQKFVRNCQRLLVIVQHLSKQSGLIQQAVFMHGILSLRDLILLERFLRLTDESKTIAEIGAHIGIIGAFRDCLLIMVDRVGPVLPIVVPIGKCAGRVGRRHI